MEELLKQILENQSKIDEKLTQVQYVQDKIITKMKEIDDLQNKMEYFKSETDNFNKEAMKHFEKIEDELHANLDDISYIFREYDSKFAKIK